VATSSAYAVAACSAAIQPRTDTPVGSDSDSTICCVALVLPA
jgi:hypothetical protein